MMKIKRLLPSLVCGIALTGGAGLTARAQDPAVIAPSADATVRSEAPDGNFGGETDLEVMNSDGLHAMVYLRFDASESPQIKKIVDIEAYALPQKRPRTVEVFLLDPAGGEWSEGEITWNTAPGNNPSTQRLAEGSATRLGGLGAPDTHSAKTVHMEWENEEGRQTLLDALNNGSRRATLVLVRPTDKAVVFTSREHTAPAAHPPRILAEHAD